jgi:hypothetical protein
MENNAKRLEPTDKNKGSKIRDNAAWNKSSDKKREKRAATAAIAPRFFLSSREYFS